MERDVFTVVVRPVAVENPSGGLVARVQRGARQRRQHVEVRELALVADQEFDRALEHRFVVVVEPENDAGIHHDPILMEHLDFFFELLDAIKRLMGLPEALLEDRFHAHKDRYAAAFRRELDHLLVVSEKQRGLAAPLQAQGLERGPQLPAVCTVAVV